MTLPLHVHSFGPKGRMTCACGITPEDAYADAMGRSAEYIRGWTDARDRIVAMLAGPPQLESIRQGLAKLTPPKRPTEGGKQ